jgi:hypothetical protein
VSASKPVVLYITGMMRCGSTFVGNVLNELPGTVHVGERYFIWKNAVLRDGTNTMCGCGLDLLECAMWSTTLRRAVGMDRQHAKGMWAAQQRYMRTRHTIPRLLEARGVTTAPAAVHRTVDSVVSFYRTVVAECGARVIVDSSKYPAEAVALSRRTDIDFRLLHLVRDPRATVASFLSAKSYLEKMRASRTLAYWAGFNTASEAAGAVAGRDRYLRLRYEDFTRSPRQVMSRIIDFAGYDSPQPVPFDSDRTVVLGVNHTVTGNPDRLRRGRTEVRTKEDWRETMSFRRKLATCVCVGPLMLRYGYLS